MRGGQREGEKGEYEGMREGGGLVEWREGPDGEMTEKRWSGVQNGQIPIQLCFLQLSL